MLTNTLNTNEVKDAAGVEIQFTRLSIADRSTEFASEVESPATPHRLTISHEEIGTGLTRRRRSKIRFDKTSAGQVDTTTVMKGSVYVVTDSPIGNCTDNTLITGLIANLTSFLATTGAGTTVLFDGTGNGAVVLRTGGI